MQCCTPAALTLSSTSWFSTLGASLTADLTSLGALFGGAGGAGAWGPPFTACFTSSFTTSLAARSTGFVTFCGSAAFSTHVSGQLKPAH